MIAIASFLVFLVFSGFSSPSAAAASSGSSGAVQIGPGCLQLPQSYRVVRTDAEEEVVESMHGFLDAPYRSKVYWSFGVSERDPLIAADEREVLWQRTERVEGRKIRFGLVEENGSRSLYAVDRLIHFRIDSEDPDALRQLRNVAASYRQRARSETCRLPERNSWSG